MKCSNVFRLTLCSSQLMTVVLPGIRHATLFKATQGYL